MNDTTVWIIALGFFAPLHYMGPVLVTFLTGSEDSGRRRRLLQRVLIDCTLSMLAGVAIAVWLFRSEPAYAGTVFLLVMAAPYLYLWWARR